MSSHRHPLSEKRRRQGPRQVACALALACLGLLSGCQTAPVAVDPGNPRVTALRELGFRPTREGWELDFSERILFALDSAVIEEPLRPAIARIGRTLHAAGVERMRVDGHTDSSGSRAHNDALSLRRARAVEELLVAAGIDPAGISARALGSGAPVADNTTEEGRAQNRRVAIVVMVP